jgi:pyridoxal phosphate enzyme (YggS family)
MSPIDPDQVAANVAAVEALIATRATRPARLVAVTKGFGVEAPLAALAAGVRDLGENYAQELLAKHRVLGDEMIACGARWHFIGHLQRNKVRLLADAVSCWQTIDSLRVGAEVAARAPGAEVLVQVNLARSGGQGGAAETEVGSLVGSLRDLGLDVAGLMMIGRAGDPDGTRMLFRALREMADALELVECSMGMSGDLEIALEEGATIVRVGTAIFGERPPRS